MEVQALGCTWIFSARKTWSSTHFAKDEAEPHPEGMINVSFEK
ncbi:MAG: hypothetical protein WA102_04310 [Candidatus Methanoperedens sp.]